MYLAFAKCSFVVDSTTRVDRESRTWAGNGSSSVRGTDGVLSLLSSPIPFMCGRTTPVVRSGFGMGGERAG